MNVAPEELQLTRELFASMAPHEPTEEGKARFTFALAKVLHQKNRNWGLVIKTSGNNVDGKSVDLVMWKPTGTIIDVVAGGLGPNGPEALAPLWNEHEAALNLPQSRWLEPEDSAEPSKPEPSVVCNCEAALEAAVAELKALIAAIPQPPPPVVFPDYEGKVLGFGVTLRPKKQ